MANTYSWDVSLLKCHPQHENRKNVVFMVYWRRQAADGVNGVDTYGSQEIAFDPTAPFTPYENITLKQVEEWLVKAIGAKEVAAMDARLAEQLANKAASNVVTPPIPWA